MSYQRKNRNLGMYLRKRRLTILAMEKSTTAKSGDRARPRTHQYMR